MKRSYKGRGKIMRTRKGIIEEKGQMRNEYKG